jgi:hypothetical protein
MILFRAKYADGETELLDLTKYAKQFDTHGALWAAAAREAAIFHQDAAGFPVGLVSLEMIQQYCTRC